MNTIKPVRINPHQAAQGLFRLCWAVMLLALGLAAGPLAPVAASPAPQPAAQLGAWPATPCGGLRLDEFYACQYGHWQPDAQPVARVALTSSDAREDETPSPARSCGGLMLHEFYACQYGNWRPGPTCSAGLLALLSGQAASWSDWNARSGDSTITGSYTDDCLVRLPGYFWDGRGRYVGSFVDNFTTYIVFSNGGPASYRAVNTANNQAYQLLGH